jgi:hypothetical protein
MRYWPRPARPGSPSRVEQLAETRAEALDAQAVDLERIERDLHAGAQARLVALGLTLSLAQQQVHRDPGRGGGTAGAGNGSWIFVGYQNTLLRQL